MKKEINIAEILKDKPQGTKLYSSACGKCKLEEVDDKSFKISFYNSKFGLMNGGEGYLDKNGKLYDDGECVVFPSKEMRSWHKFAWKTGDVLVSNDGKREVLFKTWVNDSYTKFVGLHCLINNDNEEVEYDNGTTVFNTNDFKFIEAEDAAQTYINTIEERFGGKINRDTLEIEKLEFKDGDIAFADYGNRQDVFIVSDKTDLSEGYNSFISLDLSGLTLNMGYRTSFFEKDLCKLRLATEEEKQQLFDALAKEGKAWDAEKKQIVDLKPKYEFKPMDLCLMKYIGKYNNRGWELCQYAYTEHRVSSSGEQRDFYHAVGGEIYAECIPYKGNEHLLGTKKSK